MTDAIRTPEERLRGLPDFPFESEYRQIDSLRLAHLDIGDGPPVLFVHGEPTWSFLWRKVIPAVRDAGYRVLAPDLPGFGRSHKPVDLEWYSYDRHTASVVALVDELDLRDATVVVHDWGGPIGLRMRSSARADRAHRRARHRPLHRSPADDQRVDGVPRVCRANRGPSGGAPRRAGLLERTRRRGDRGV